MLLFKLASALRGQGELSAWWTRGGHHLTSVGHDPRWLGHGARWCSGEPRRLVAIQGTRKLSVNKMDLPMLRLPATVKRSGGTA